MNARLTRIKLNQRDEDELLKLVRPRTYLTDDSWTNWGLPDSIEERKKAKRERRYRFFYWAGIYFVIFVVGFFVGRNIV